MDVHPIIKQQFRNNIFIVSSFLLQIWTWNHLSKEVDAHIQICKYFFSDFPSNFPSFLLFSLRIEFDRNQFFKRNNTEEEYSRSCRFSWKAKFIAVNSVYRTVGRHNAEWPLKFSKPKRKQPPSLTSFCQAFGRREANNKVVGACILLHFLGVHCNRVARMRAQNLQFSTMVDATLSQRIPFFEALVFQIIPYLFIQYELDIYIYIEESKSKVSFYVCVIPL